MPLWRSRINKVAVLERPPRFAGLSAKDLERIGRPAEEIEVPAGKQLAATGEAGTLCQRLRRAERSALA
jgi:hypothetical protein